MDDEEQSVTAVDPTAAECDEGESADVRVDRILEHVDDSMKLDDAWPWATSKNSI